MDVIFFDSEASLTKLNVLVTKYPPANLLLIPNVRPKNVANSFHATVTYWSCLYLHCIEK